ncbi:hypothetical protein RF679_16855 [Undibacterium cyanobacteriorum]|uniref:Uncharacterized protein n=1 Tax=Undibacterium cyanobacteriorum TaxID=3073561 RepID=A0ABY9RGG6_9BURK|nr:hypothetical protein [Undibacterium sp. 20NA77.5]WMW80297.1 hypothetical protein RF679_16855 [Undibacterium sp. 20NA77.5]
MNAWCFPILSLRQRAVAWFAALVSIASWLLAFFSDAGLARYWSLLSLLLPPSIAYFMSSRLLISLRYFQKQIAPVALAQVMQERVRRLMISVFVVLLVANFGLQMGAHFATQLSLLATQMLGLCLGIYSSLGFHIKLNMSRTWVRKSGLHRLVHLLLASSWVYFTVHQVLTNTTPLELWYSIAAISCACAFLYYFVTQRPQSFAHDEEIKDTPRLFSKLSTWLLHHFYRYRRLGPQTNSSDESNTDRGLVQPIAVFCLMIAIYFFACVPQASQVGFNRLLYLAAMSLILSSHLVIRDWHWRYLLMPRGLVNQGFAWQLWRSNLTIFLGLGVIFFLGKAIFERLADSSHVATTLLASFADALTFMLEIAAVFAGACVMAAAENLNRSRFKIYLLMLFLACSVYGIAYTSGRVNQLQNLFGSDWRYQFSLVFASALLFGLARHRWSPQRIRANYSGT